MVTDSNLYALEKLNEALYCLVAGADRVQARLGKAMRYLMEITPGYVPDSELRQMLVGIKDDLTFAGPTHGEGRVEATLRGLDDEDASAIAVRILELHNRLWELIRHQGSELPASAAKR